MYELLWFVRKKPQKNQPVKPPEKPQKNAVKKLVEDRL